MKIFFEDKLGGFDDDFKDIIQRVADGVMQSEGITEQAEISVMITDNEGIRQYNRDYREKDVPTDVLSFPMLEFETSGLIDADMADFDGETLLLGDVIISIERAKEQATEYGHSFEREIGFLAAHSMLHLLGYDHETPQQEAVMLQKQKAVLQTIGLKR